MASSSGTDDSPSLSMFELITAGLGLLFGALLIAMAVDTIRIGSRVAPVPDGGSPVSQTPDATGPTDQVAAARTARTGHDAA